MGSGLLKKANLLTTNQDKGLAFSNFIQKYSKKSFAILSKQNNFYFAENSHGFDGDSLFASYSTIDFWDGIISEKNKVFNFTENDNSLNTVVQLFSFNMKNDVSTVSIYSTEDKILILFNGTISDGFIRDFKQINYNINSFDYNSINQSYIEKYSAEKYVIKYSDAVNSFVESKNKPEISNLLKNALFNEIYGMLLCNFHSPNCITKTTNNDSKIILFTEEKLEKELLEKHIQLSLSEIIGNFSKQISVSYEGNASSFDEIKDFLKVE